MYISRLLLAAPVIVTTVIAAPADDMRSLHSSFESAADVLNASLNSTMAMDTSGLVQNLTWQVGASYANLANLNSSNSSSQFTNATGNVDSAYLGYVDSISTLSEAAIRRAKVSHQELNMSVYNALQGLAIAVQAYGLQLRNANMISQNATIRTFTAGSSLVEAQAAWFGTSGRRRRVRRATSTGWLV